MNRILIFVALVTSVDLSRAPACSICGGDFRNRPTLRQDAGTARVVVYGKLSNARLNPDPLDGNGTTDLKVERVVKGGDRIAVGATVTLPRYFPADGKVTQVIATFDVVGGKLSYVGARPVSGSAPAEYLADLLAIPASDPVRLLDLCHRRLDHDDADVAADAFLELTRATDADVARAAKSFSPDRFRRLLANERTPKERVGLFGFLLGICGTEKDAEVLSRLIKLAPDDVPSMLRGLLAGYIELKPREGWRRAIDIVSDERRGFLHRHAVLGTLEFFWNSRRDQHRDSILLGMKALVRQGDLADYAVEDLRRWACWDLTKDVLAQYGRKSHESVITRRAILRYALACPRPEAATFVAELRKRTPDFVADVEEGIREEKERK